MSFVSSVEGEPARAPSSHAVRRVHQLAPQLLLQLDLKDLEQSSPSTDQLFEVLRASPGLAELTLTAILPAVSTATQAPIHLSELKRMTAVTLPTALLHGLLVVLRIPNCTFAYIQPSSSPNVNTTTDILASIEPPSSPKVDHAVGLFDSSTSHMIEVLGSILSAMEEIHIRTRNEQINLHTINPSCDPLVRNVTLYLTNLTTLASASAWLFPLFFLLPKNTQPYVTIDLSPYVGNGPDE